MGVTVIEIVPLTLWTVAVIVTAPGATEVTSPAATLAMVASDDFHCAVVVSSAVAPVASVAVAVHWVWIPGPLSDVLAHVTVTAVGAGDVAVPQPANATSRITTLNRRSILIRFPGALPGESG